MSSENNNDVSIPPEIITDPLTELLTLQTTNTKKRKRNKRKTVYDEIVSLKQEQSFFKKEFNTKFLIELEEILTKCFAPTKRKKEHFITKEKLTLEFLKLLQTQKRFKSTDSMQQFLLDMAVFDVEENLIGKIIQVHFGDRMVEICTLPGIKNKKTNVFKRFSEVVFFDFYSSQLEDFFKKQSIYYQDCTYRDIFAFLCHKDKKNCEEKLKELTRYSLGRGVPMLKDQLNVNKDIHDV